MDTHFPTRDVEAFGSIAGCCSLDACLIFMAYHQLLADEGMAGDVLQIGVRDAITALVGKPVSVPVHVTNLSQLPLAPGGSPFGLSYHVMTPDHRTDGTETGLVAGSAC